MKNYSGGTNNLPKYFTEEEILVVLENAKKEKYRDYVLLKTLWETGLRCSELCNLKKMDIKEGQLEVRGGKGGKDRMVPLSPTLEDLLHIYTDQLKYNEKIFPISDRSVRYIVEKHRTRSDMHTHSFRHSYAVHALKKGVNLRSLQKALGHSSLQTTQVYLDIVAEDIKEDFKKVWV